MCMCICTQIVYWYRYSVRITYISGGPNTGIFVSYSKLLTFYYYYYYYYYYYSNSNSIYIYIYIYIYYFDWVILIGLRSNCIPS